jgi:hypothetical protein
MSRFAPLISSVPMPCQIFQRQVELVPCWSLHYKLLSLVWGWGKLRLEGNAKSWAPLLVNLAG